MLVKIRFWLKIRHRITLKVKIHKYKNPKRKYPAAINRNIDGVPWKLNQPHLC